MAIQNETPGPVTEPSWAELVELEPKLADLLKLAENYPKDSPSFCANAAWYGYGGTPSLKDALCKLIGWDRQSKDPTGVLGSEAAYDVAYDVLWESLPDCQHPGGRFDCS